MQAAATMSRNGTSRLLVVEGEHLVGIVSLKDLFELLAVKLELRVGLKPAPRGLNHRASKTGSDQPPAAQFDHTATFLLQRIS